MSINGTPSGHTTVPGRVGFHRSLRPQQIAGNGGISAIDQVMALARSHLITQYAVHADDAVEFQVIVSTAVLVDAHGHPMVTRNG